MATYQKCKVWFSSDNPGYSWLSYAVMRPFWISLDIAGDCSEIYDIAGCLKIYFSLGIS
jgi:hypothetical protein